MGIESLFPGSLLSFFTTIKIVKTARYRGFTRINKTLIELIPLFITSVDMLPPVALLPALLYNNSNYYTLNSLSLF